MHNIRNKIIGCIYVAFTVLLLLLGSSCYIGFTVHRIQGNGIVRTETLRGHSFDAVSVSGDWTVDIRQSETLSVTINADENLFDYLDIYVSDHTLHIGFQSGYVIARSRCKAIITMPVLTRLKASGSLTGRISSFYMPGREMSVALSGSGDVTADDIIVRNLKLKISGSGSFMTTGKVQNLEGSISGSGNIKAADLKTANADISISGSGSATVWVTGLLTARISGSGSIRYKGNPVIVRKTSGSGGVYLF